MVNICTGVHVFAHVTAVIANRKEAVERMTFIYEYMSLLIGNIYSGSLSTRDKQISPTRKRKQKPHSVLTLMSFWYTDMFKLDALFQIHEHTAMW